MGWGEMTDPFEPVTHMCTDCGSTNHTAGHHLCNRPGPAVRELRQRLETAQADARRMEYERDDARRNEQRADERLGQMREALAGALKSPTNETFNDIIQKRARGEITSLEAVDRIIVLADGP